MLLDSSTYFVLLASYFELSCCIIMLMQPQDQNPYNFILDPATQKRKPGLSMLQNPKQKNIFAVIFVIIIIMVVVIAVSIFQSLGKQDNGALVSVNAYQTEIIRISELGLKSATDPNTRATVSTLQSFITSDQVDTKSYLTKNGVTITPQQEILKKDSTLDTDLDTASQRNRYDEVLISILQDLQSAYKASLQSAIGETTTPNRKILLNNAAANILTFENS
ncbi:MAG: hypothetical protein ACI9T8_000209 [Candidatus Saccharimonadales bacterium]|jgi:hypothetical protein